MTCYIEFQLLQSANGKLNKKLQFFHKLYFIMNQSAISVHLSAMFDALSAILTLLSAMFDVLSAILTLLSAMFDTLSAILALSSFSGVLPLVSGATHTFSSEFQHKLDNLTKLTSELKNSCIEFYTILRT
ncbi:hypothetical protein PVA17_03530 [Lysinibacillus sp. CNPSo 3705]|uniref:hypothetical protein n=1 Tax=Lysinibacillus sp. CNPSo 3705 TaxID=3028148 RepID=UPI0023636802|nr:hypothetical protein [Lysinibacillus sp. CNPSo 3705]MDD1501840.1 hypothetical protein [Lysinibacillus sp. CNPSo 3705]